MTYIYRYSTAGRPSKAQNCSSNLLQGTRSAYCMPHTVQNDCSMQNVYLANYSSKRLSESFSCRPLLLRV